MLKSVNIPHLSLGNDRLLSAIAAAGFGGVDISLYGVTADRDESLRAADALRSRLDQFGLVCAQTHLPEYGLFKSSEIADEETTRRIENSFEVMRILECRWGAYHPRSATNFGYDSNRAMRDNLDQLSRFLEKADRQGVGIAVENIPIFPDCPQYRFFGADYEEHMELIDRLNTDNIGVCWDFGHANLMPYDMGKMIGKFGKRIKIVHIHDNFRTMDMHIAPFLGTIDWDQTMHALCKSGFSGPLSLELKETPDELWDTHFGHCFSVACALERRFV